MVTLMRQRDWSRARVSGIVAIGFAAALTSRTAVAEGNAFQLGLTGGLLTRPAPEAHGAGETVGGGGGLSLGAVLGPAYLGLDVGGYAFGTGDQGQLSLAYLGADVGVEAHLPAELILRPHLGAGLAAAHFVSLAEPEPGRDWYELWPYAKPSVALFLVGPQGYVGLDVGVLLSLPDSASLSVALMMGVRL